MHVKCSYCNVTLKTVTSVILWLDVVICGCILFVQISEAQDESCLDGRKDCSVNYHVAECLAINIIVALVALYGVRENKPDLLLPFIACKFLLVTAIAAFILFGKYLANNELKTKWLPRIDQCNVFAICIIFGFQLYLIFIAIWCYKTTRKTVLACKAQKSFKSIVSVWIGGPSNLSNSASESTCIIETL